jgi:hypothetical protein
MGAFVEVKEMYAPPKFFTTIGGFSSADFAKTMGQAQIMINADGEYPVFKVMEYINELRKRFNIKRRGFATTDGATEESEDVSSELKKEQILKVRIENQEKLKQLIPVPAARKRVQTTLQAVANKIRYAIKQSAPLVAICQDARDCENILIQNYNGAIELLSAEAIDQSWEDYSASHQPGRTQLSSTSREDTGNGSSKEDATSPAG